MPKILIVTTEPDPHVDMVLQYLSDIEVVVFDPLQFPDNRDISYRIGPGFDHAEVISNGVNLNDVISVWYRKPNYLAAEDFERLAIPTPFQEYASHQYQRGVKALFDLLNGSYWVSRPSSISRADNKILQLEVANSVGLSIPETLVTTSPEAVTKFRHQIGDIVTKTIGVPMFKVNGQWKIYYTQTYLQDAAMDLSGLSITPMIFQQKVEKQADIRVTVIGNSIFACRIITPGQDWRTYIGSNEISYEVYKLPEQIRTGCLELVQRLGLEFGAIDFVEDKNGNLWFIEINPNGQWGFVEQHTGMHMAKAMADLLLRGNATQ